MRRQNSVWLIVLTALSIPLAAATKEHFSVSVPSGPVSVWLGDTVTLPCSVTPPMDVRPMEIRWYRPSQHHNPILLYKDQQIQLSSKNQQYQGRVSLMGLEPGVGGLEDGNIALILTDVTALDSGKYECYVGSDQWYETGLISLIVKNVGSIPVLSVYPSNKEEQVNVSCMSQNWSPEPRVTWRDDKGTELKNQKSSYTTDSQGLVAVSSWLLFSSDSGWLSCGVSISGGDSRESRVTPVSISCPSAGTGWMAAFIALLLFSMLAIAVLSVLFTKSRRKGPKEPERNDTELEKSSSVVITGSNTEVKEKDKHPNSSTETKALLTDDKRNKPSIKVGWTDARRHAVNILLDKSTAHRNLKILGTQSVIYSSEYRGATVSSKRFSYHTCVLGRSGFSSGQHYWEVQLEDAEKKEVKKSWSVGVASASAHRYTNVPLSTQEGFWVLSYNETEDFCSKTDPPEQVLQGVKLKKLGVFLDCDQHTVSFYNAEKRKHLFTHQGLKAEAIYPLFNPGKTDSISLTLITFNN